MLKINDLTSSIKLLLNGILEIPVYEDSPKQKSSLPFVIYTITSFNPNKIDCYPTEVSLMIRYCGEKKFGADVLRTYSDQVAEDITQDFILEVLSGYNLYHAIFECVQQGVKEYTEDIITIRQEYKIHIS